MEIYGDAEEVINAEVVNALTFNIHIKNGGSNKNLVSIEKEDKTNQPDALLWEVRQKEVEIKKRLLGNLAQKNCLNRP